MKNTKILLLLLFITSSYSRLPSSFKKCNRKQSDFQECLRNAVQDAIRQLSKPFKEVGLGKLEPLVIPVMNIRAGAGAASFQQNYTDIISHGLSKGKVLKFEMNFETKTIIMEVFYRELHFDYQYKFKGKMLMIPIYGAGPGTVSFTNMTNMITFNLQEYNDKGKKHFKIISTKLFMDPEILQVKFENLFDGNKVLGDIMNKQFNNHWKEIYSDVKANYEEAFGQFLGAMFSNVLAKVPISELFGDE